METKKKKKRIGEQKNYSTFPGKRNGPNFKFLKAMKINAGKSEPIRISPKFEEVIGPFTGEVEKTKEEGESANTCSLHRDLRRF